jgi:hypothetical protein
LSYCNLPERLTGPYNQTLFLGCSVSNFTCNLAWGAEQSTLQVNLVEDNCYHPQSIFYGSMDLQLDSITQQPENTNSTAFTKNGDVFNTNDPAKTVHKTIAFSEKDKENARDQENATLSYDNKDYGKVVYDINGNRGYWTEPDPYFIGAPGNKFNSNGYDILGVPVRFKFNDFSFGGIVSSWKQAGSQGGLRSFDVEIKSFASLLNGVQLIIGGYGGGICGIVPNTSNNPTGKNIAMPMPYGVDFYENSPPVFSFFDYTADIAQGNIPNVINIYGHLTYLGYKNKVYGGAGLNQEGMRSQDIYDSLEALLGLNSHNNIDHISPFSPYGAIISRSIRNNYTSSEVDPFSETYNNLNLTHMGICPNSIAVDGHRRSRLKLDLSEVPRPPRWLRTQGEVISLMQFISDICDGSGFDFFVDFIPPDSQQIAHNISGIIKIRTVSRRQQPKKDQIQALINYLVTNNGVTSYNKGKEFTDVNTRSMYIGGKQKRLLQCRTERFAFTQNTLIWDPWVGQLGVFIDYNPIGGGTNATAGTSVASSIAYGTNLVRQPNLLSTRRYSFKSSGGAAVASDSYGFNDSQVFGKTTNFARGNYTDTATLGGGLGFEKFEYMSKVLTGSEAAASTRNLPIYTDAICPYFGIGSNGLARPVYFDKNMGQMQIIFQMSDLDGLISYPLSSIQGPYPDKLSIFAAPVFLVLENEIRAAGGGFMQWMTYCFSNIFSTDISEILYKAFKNHLGLGGKPAKNLWLAGMDGILKSMGRQTIGIDNRVLDSINLSSVAPYFRELHADLEKVHGFFQGIASEYYGKKYMIRMPELAWYQDISVATDNNNNAIVLGNDESGNPIYALEGTNTVFTNYSVSSDGAWEEPGNMIDDTIAVGGIKASFFTDETGKIGPIVGYNASMEKDTGRLWARQQFLSQAIRYRPYAGAPYTVFDWSHVMKLNYEDPLLQDNTHWYIPLSYQIEESMILPYNHPEVNVPMAHNMGMYRQPVPFDKRYKMYAKGTTESDLVFLAANSAQPRAIVSVPSPVLVGVGRNGTDDELNAVMVQDALARLRFGASVPLVVQGLLTLGSTLGGTGFAPGSTTIWGGLGLNPAYEDAAQRSMILVVVPVGENTRDPEKGQKGFSPKYGYTSYFLGKEAGVGGFGGVALLDYMIRDLEFTHMMSFGYENEIKNSNYRAPVKFDAQRNRMGVSSEDAYEPNTILPRAAFPLFCAIPLEMNDAVYGPWINHPGLIKDNIFPDSNNSLLDVENLVGGVKVIVDPTLTPWNYGGMGPLDDAVMSKIADDVNYQQVLENGSVQIPGFANFNLGDAIQFYGSQFNGPVLTSINVQIGENGVSSTYNFRTYIRKIGFFNKENADRVKALNQESLKRNREINNKLLKLASRMGISPGSFRII